MKHPPRWPELRAGFIAFVVLVNFLAALPLPSSVKRSGFEEPVAKEEIGRISTQLAAVGIEASHEDLVEFFMATGEPMVKLRGWLMAPTKELYRVTGAGQAWGLFTYPDTFPHRLVVEAQRGVGRWEVLFAGLDPDHRWREDLFTYRRVRGIYDGNTNKPGASYKNFCAWVAREVFAEFPDYQSVRVKFQRFHTTVPGLPKDEQVLDRHVRTYKREAM